MNKANELQVPVVCALIPAYNAGEFLEKAVESLLVQTRKLDRIIVIDDASTDSSTQTIRKWIDEGLVELISNPTNLGRAKSLNRAFEEVEADYFVLLDADDISLPNRVELQLAFMEANPALGCSSSFIEYISSTGNILGIGKLDIVNQEVFEHYFKIAEHFALFCPAAILRAEVVKREDLRFRGEFWPADDIDLWNRIGEAGWSVLAQPEILVQYRIHGSSAVTSSFVRTRMQYEWLRHCLRARRTGKPEPTRDEFLAIWNSASLLVRCNRFRKIQSKGFYRAAGFSFAERRRVKAIGQMMISLSMAPSYAASRIFQQFRGRTAKSNLTNK